MLPLIRYAGSAAEASIRPQPIGFGLVGSLRLPPVAIDHTHSIAEKNPGIIRGPGPCYWLARLGSNQRPPT